MGVNPLTLSSHKTDLCTHYLIKIMHEFLKEIYNDFCTKHDMLKNKDGAYQSADDYLWLSTVQSRGGGYMYPQINLSQYQQNWLDNYRKLWKQTNGGEDI